MARLLQPLRHHMTLWSTIVAASILPWAFVPSATTLHAVDGLASIDPLLSGRTHSSSQNEKFIWSYEGPNGPDNWADLKDDYATCESGHQQSPIDIPSRLKPQLLPVEFLYQEASAVVVDTGRALALHKFSREEESIAVGDETYDLTAIEFHSPSEHTVGGFNYPMEIQLIHTNTSGKSVGLSVFVERVQGPDRPLATQVLAVMQDPQPKKGVEVVLNPMELIPKPHRGWFYSGSQTTPPCQENRKWFVFSDTVEFSPAQITAFRKFYPANVRPIQNLFERLVAPKSSVFTH